MTLPFENNNDAIVKKLAKRSFQINRLRNIVAVVAIMLTAILFTSVTTIGIGTMESMQLNMQRQKMSRADAEIRMMTPEQFALLQSSDMVKVAGLRRPIEFLTNSVRHNIELDVMDSTQMELVFTTPTHGKAPQAANEIVASDRALRDLGVEPEVGAEVIIEFTAHGKEYVLPMTVSGWYESIHEQLSMMVLSPSFVEAYPDIFEYTYHEDFEMAGTYFSDIVLKNRMGIQGQLDDFVRSAGGEPHNQDAPNFLPATVNQMTNPTPSIGIIVMLVMFVILFMACGYLLIYNVFDISVMQSIRQYGLYRTVGMSKKQMTHLINKQAIWLSFIGIPLGLLGGYLIGKFSLPIIMRIVSTEYSNLDTNVSPKPLIFIGAALLTILTVWFSTRKPVRMATNIPPIEAFRYVEKLSGGKSDKKGVSGAKISNMAWSNLSRNRRRTMFIVVSLVLCVTLLNSVGIISGSVDVEKQIQETIRTDFCVVNTSTMSNFMGFRHHSDALNDDAIQAINGQPGIETGSIIYKNTLDDLNVAFDFGQPIEKTVADPDEEGHIIGYGGELVLPLGVDGYPSCNVFGMDEVALARLNIVEGEMDFAKLYWQISNGNGVIIGIEGDMKTQLPYEYLDTLEIGDTVTARVDGREIKTYTVAAKAALNGNDMEVGLTTRGFSDVGGDAPALYFPIEQYKELYRQPTIMKYSFNVADNQQAALSVFLKDYTENVDPSVAYFSAELARQNAESTRNMISFVGGIVGAIFGIAGILNLINMLITSILTRRHEFATMQSIGMTKKQLTAMVTFESLYYAMLATAFGISLSVVIGSTVVRNFCATQWNFTYHMTLLPAVCVCLTLLVFAVFIPLIAIKIFNKGSITEQLRHAE